MGVCRHKRNKVGIGLLLQLKRRSIMKKIDIYEELKSNDYPGRGIVIDVYKRQLLSLSFQSSGL